MYEGVVRKPLTAEDQSGPVARFCHVLSIALQHPSSTRAHTLCAVLAVRNEIAYCVSNSLDVHRSTHSDEQRALAIRATRRR
jgi:hypothetical protein